MRLLKHNELREAVNGNEETTVHCLLDALGAEREIIVNMAPSGQNTLLFLAAQLGNGKILGMLLDGGADGRAHPVTKYSPLYVACHNGHLGVSKVLLERFPELVNELTVEKWLPFHAAAINGNIAIVELLLNHNYPEFVMQTHTDPTGEYEWKFPFDPNTQDVTGQTALYVSCLLGNKKLVEILLDWKVKFVKIGGGDDGKMTPVTSPLSPTGRRISYGIMSIMSRLSLGREVEEHSNDLMRNPLMLNTLCGAARETALLGEFLLLNFITRKRYL